MTFSGQVQNGVVVFDQPVAFPEGTRVRVEAVASATPESKPAALPLAARLGNFLRHSVDLPEDAARQHDHYLYGHAKR